MSPIQSCILLGTDAFIFLFVEFMEIFFENIRSCSYFAAAVKDNDGELQKC